MRKVIFKVELTLDGFMSGPKGEMDWAQPHVTTEENSEDVFGMLSSVDTVLMSGIIYQGFKAYWPAAGTDPKSSKSIKEISKWLNDTPKMVFSKSLDHVDWMNSRLIKGDAGNEIAALKQQPGKNFVIFGGSVFPQALMKMGLIDEFWVNVHPVILGTGRQLFTDKKDHTALRRIGTKIFESGAVGLRYESVR